MALITYSTNEIILNWVLLCDGVAEQAVLDNIM